MKKAVIYSRVSTEIQDYASQTKELLNDAKKMGYEVTQIYEEKESGFVDDRSELAKILSLTLADTDAIFVWEISRLSRRTVKVLSDVEDIENKGILIYSKNENYRSWNENGEKDSTSKLVLTLYASIAESEAKKFRERSKRGKRYNVLVEKKCYTSKLPFGYMKDENGKLVINEEEAVVVRDMFQKAIEGYSIDRLKVYLKGKGYDFSRAILSMLKNTLYVGKKRMGEVALKNKKKKDDIANRVFNPNEDIIETPAIISQETFDRCAKALKERANRSYSSIRTERLLRGLVYCTRCGGLYSNCGKRYKCCYTHDNCHSSDISVKFDDVVWNITEEIFSNDIAKEMADKNAEPILAELANLNAEIEGYRATLKTFKPKINSLAMLAVETDTYDVVKDKIKALKKEKDITEQEIASRVAKVDKLQKKLVVPTATISKITDFSEKREFVTKVIEAIYMYGFRLNQIAAIQYNNGITVYCIRNQYDFYWFYNKGGIVIEDAIKMANNANGTFVNDSKDNTYIDVTDSTIYSSSEDTAIYGRYSIVELYRALLQNNQLTKVELKV